MPSSDTHIHMKHRHLTNLGTGSYHVVSQPFRFSQPRRRTAPQAGKPLLSSFACPRGLVTQAGLDRGKRGGKAESGKCLVGGRMDGRAFSSCA